MSTGLTIAAVIPLVNEAESAPFETFLFCFIALFVMQPCTLNFVCINRQTMHDIPAYAYEAHYVLRIRLFLSILYNRPSYINRKKYRKIWRPKGWCSG